MPYDIFAWVEVAEGARAHPKWKTVLDAGEMVGSPDAVSRDDFGLSKTASTKAPFANRGVPADASPLVQQQLAEIAAFEKEESAESGFQGHTYITFDELKRLDLSASLAWQRLSAAMANTQAERQCSGTEMRLVLWANW